jgi:hypothetical protein
MPWTAEGDERADARREGGADRAEREHRQADREQPPAPEAPQGTAHGRFAILDRHVP